ncbi:MAG: TIM barrel protein [bacterium]|nr:TIM barrel protein [bacterium]
MNEVIRSDRRRFIQISAAAAASAALNAAPSLAAQARAKKRSIPLGFDNFSIRALEWKAPQIVDYANQLGVDLVLFSDLDIYESLDDAYLKDLKAKADGYGIQLYAGTGGVCPTSKAFNNKWGTAEEHLDLVIRVARTLGSPVARCYQGTGQDRTYDGGIRRHMQAMVETLKKVRGKALDAGVHIAVENHAGDMQAWELKWVIENAGPDFVGATIDSGNAAWTLESPQSNLEILGPYVKCSGMRDSAIWRYEDGAKVAWCSPGDGQLDWNQYLSTWKKLCPDQPFILEIINWINDPRQYAYFKPEFWNGYEDIPAKDFALFAAMAEQGKPYQHPADRPKEDLGKQQMYDLERSIKFMDTLLT